LRCLTTTCIVVMAGVPLQALASHADPAVHEFISELKASSPSLTVPSRRPMTRAAKDGLEVVLQRVVTSLGVAYEIVNI
jgi:hypothetical protein